MPFVIWITGLPGSGKSTIADALKPELANAVVLRMDELRKIATPHPTYAEDERDLLYRALVFTAIKLYENGHNVIIDATANMRRWRELARNRIKDYIEVYLKCTVEECRMREIKRADTHLAPKDIYKKADAGWPVPGVNVPYEEPLDPDIVIDTEKTDISTSVEMILEKSAHCT
ncbi:putative adenylyl-sulfate kinase [bacterium BMS3Abin07]|nr:putative adenylyl-sulfate kinase [bacterium BMS3Abin07]GBE31378.1 putative adenylyl-sulfate kinase [bacterium BMS3Bbin05]HDL20643.1 adenylyl-sulfate kinase [Nitrospirota bacterium]HDO22347.1 adenylyl-sulfate kinase [Nitrospirota bacterium]